MTACDCKPLRLCAKTTDCVIKHSKEFENDIQVYIDLVMEAHYHGHSIKTLIEECGLDINMRAYWPGAEYEETTLLLSAVEYRDYNLIKQLLELGADVTAISSKFKLGIIDNMLWGHSYYDTHDSTAIKKCEKIWNIIKEYNPPLRIKRLTMTQFYNYWKLKESPILLELVQKCSTVYD
jgi:hypothetical protein